ncbi:hypothetical protein LSAT2_012820 [Lamellibrachia satsuma]|nr:hypothetical protein LSAT2_012820 [Lamellibrachia satsuma]
MRLPERHGRCSRLGTRHIGFVSRKVDGARAAERIAFDHRLRYRQTRLRLANARRSSSDDQVNMARYKMTTFGSGEWFLIYRVRSLCGAALVDLSFVKRITIISV